nr:putative 4-hydroxy-4-methyl-2-oxoglutarate aldolase 3 [Malus domestica]
MTTPHPSTPAIQGSNSSITIQKIDCIVPRKLKRENYLFWKLQFETVFKRNKVTGIVDGSEPCPSPLLVGEKRNDGVNPAFDIWHEKDQSIIALMKATMSEDVLPLTVALTSSRDLWLNLEKRFGVPGVSSEYRRKLADASLATTDVCDANAALLDSGELRRLPPIFQKYGEREAFSGPIVTVKTFEDNTLIVGLLGTKGEGRVLVVDGEGSLRRAVTGGMLAKCAEVMGWSGIVINGCIRDVDEINRCEIGVRALATCPVRPIKSGGGQKHVPINIGGIWIQDGQWLYADGDGILVSTSQLSI